MHTSRYREKHTAQGPPCADTSCTTTATKLVRRPDGTPEWRCDDHAADPLPPTPGRV